MESLDYNSDVSNSTEDSVSFIQGDCTKFNCATPNELTVLIVAKPFDKEVDEALEVVKEFMDDNSITYYHLSGIDEDDKSSVILGNINRIVTLGGDGTILYAVKMFYNKDVPPIVSFSLGSMSFMCKFKDSDYEQVLKDCLLTNQKSCCDCSNDFIARPPNLDIRSRIRLQADVEQNQNSEPIVVKSSIFKSNQKCIADKLDICALNEVTIDSGVFGKEICLEIYINGCFLTEFHGFGLILATPTGSTAYNLSAGGAIICSQVVDTMIITPMNCRNLAMRPLVLPADCSIKLKIPRQESSPKISVDGDFTFIVECPFELIISGAHSDVPFVTSNIESPIKEWIDHINSLSVD